MRLLKRSEGIWVFHLKQEEKDLLLELLGFYPVLTPSFQPLTKTSKPEALKADQQLLEEALASQKQENAKLVRGIFSHGKRFAKSGQGWRLVLNGPQIEVLLQVLDDIRVGTWQKLGSPDLEQEPDLPKNKANLASLLVMEMSGHFQTILLRALDSGAGRA